MLSQAFFSVVLKNPWKVVVFSMLLVVSAMYGAIFLTFSNDYRDFFSEDNPQLLAFDRLQKTFSQSDNVLFVVTPKDGELFSAKTLADIEWLTEQAWLTPYSLRVDSITNFQHTRADGDDLFVGNLIEQADQMSAEELAAVKAIALQEPLLVDRLVNPAGTVTGVNVTIQLPGKSLDEVPEVAAFARDLAQQLRARNANFEVRLSGLAMLNNAFPEQSQHDMAVLYPLMLGLIVVITGALLKSFAATLVTALVIIFTIFANLGITGWIDIALTAPTTTVPVVVMTLAVADSVHILVNFLQFMRRGQSKHEAMAESLRINLSPVFLTSATTAIGFLSMNFSEAPPFRDLGNMAAIGVLIAFLLSITFLPALMMLLPVKGGQRESTGTTAMKSLGGYVVHHQRLLFWSMLILILLGVSQLPRNTLNDSFVEYFDEDVAFRAHTDYTTDNLTGIYLIEYAVNAPGEGLVSDPEFLQHLENFANWYRQQPHVIHVNSLTDIMKRLNQNLHGDDPAWYRLPEDRELAAQYLLLYEFSLPFGLDLNNQINVKKSATRLTVTLDSVSSEELLEIERNAQAWLAEHAPAYMRAMGASPDLMFAHIGHRNIRAMLEGATWALILISGLLVIALKSLRVGLISMVPNLIPLALAFGLWGLFVGQVGLALSVVTGMALGIVVDDTVHFLSKYLRARREKSLNSEQAVMYAFTTVGTAMTVTSLVLIVGFASLTLSSFQMNADMGLLTAGTIALALIADFLFLPTLLLKFGGSKS